MTTVSVKIERTIAAVELSTVAGLLFLMAQMVEKQIEIDRLRRELEAKYL